MFGGKQKRVKTGRVDFVFFEKMFRDVWARVVSKLGIMSTRSVFEHARAETALRYPILEELRIRQDGISFALLKEDKEDVGHLEEALWAYLEVFTKVLAELSGEIMSQDVLALIGRQSKSKGKEFSERLYRTGLSF